MNPGSPPKPHVADSNPVPWVETGVYPFTKPENAKPSRRPWLSIPTRPKILTSLFDGKDLFLLVYDSATRGRATHGRTTRGRVCQ